MVNRFGARLANVSAFALIAGMTMTPAERARGRFMRAPDGHGGAADLLHDEGGAKEGGDGGAKEGGEGAAKEGSEGGAKVGGEGGDGGAKEGGDGGAAAAWYAELGLSEEKPDAETLSNRAWMDKKGFKSLNDIITSQRALEGKVGAGGLTIPGEDATDEQREAFYKQIGRPDDVTGYAVPELPEGHDLDQGLLDHMLGLGHKAGAPKSMMDAMTAGFVEYQKDQLANEAAAQTADAQAKIKEWGAGANEKLAQAQRATRALGWGKDFTLKIQGAVGSGEWLERLSALGANMAEDRFINPHAKVESFGITLADAEAQLAKIDGDPETGKIMNAGGEPWKQLNARRDRLQTIISSLKDAAKAQ